MGSNAAGNAAAAMRATGSARRRCHWHLETARAKEGEGQADQERRQWWQSCATVVEAVGELHPPAALAKAAKGRDG